MSPWPIRSRLGEQIGGRSISDPLEKAKEFGEAIVKDRVVRMFGRNTVASSIAFLLDLLILWSLVELVALSHVPAAIIAFIAPLILFYFIERAWVFPGTKRGLATGFVYFAVNIGIGFVVMLTVFWALLQLTEIHYLIARVTASAVAGIVVFVLNGVFNFKQL